MIYEPMAGLHYQTGGTEEKIVALKRKRKGKKVTSIMTQATCLTHKKCIKITCCGFMGGAGRRVGAWKQEISSIIYPRYTTPHSFLTYDQQLFFLLSFYFIMQMKKKIIFECVLSTLIKHRIRT